MVWNVDSPCSKAVLVVSFLTRCEQVSFCTATWNTTVPALIASKIFLPTRAIYRFLPWSCMVSRFFYTKNRTPHLCPAVISQQRSRHRCFCCCVVLVVTVPHWLLWCFSRLCSVLPYEHHDSCCRQTRIDSVQIPAYLPFIIGNSSNLTLLCFLEQSLQITAA
jgi:hypothetical protein